MTHNNSNEPGIELKNIFKSYGSFQPLKDINLTIQQGEFFSFLGPSGCGKSTTLRIISGLESPTSGQIYLYGREATHLPPNQRPVNMVFQDYALFPHMKVIDNIMFPLKIQKVDAVESKLIAYRSLEMVNMMEFKNRYPHELSGGQRQRIALARAFACRPKSLLLDEPLGALDLQLRLQMQKTLKTIQKETGVTFVYVTHDQMEALTMSTRIGVMNNGRLVQVGTPQEIYHRPNSLFVANFIGDMTFIQGELISNSELCTVQALGQQFYATQSGNFVNNHGSVILGVRPENIIILPENSSFSSQTMNRLKVRIIDVLFRGHDFEITGQNSNETILSHVLPTSTGIPSIGDEVIFAWKYQDTLLFPSEQPSQGG